MSLKHDTEAIGRVLAQAWRGEGTEEAIAALVRVEEALEKSRDEGIEGILVAGLTVRQRYKMAAMQVVRVDANIQDYTDKIALFCGRMADAMIAEDESHAKEATDGKA